MDGVKVSALTPLSKSDIDPFGTAPTVPLAVTAGVLSEKAPYGGFPEDIPTFIVNRTAHGLIVGDAVRKTATAEEGSLGPYTKAVANETTPGDGSWVTLANSHAVVVAVKDANNYQVQHAGKVKIGNVVGGRYTGNLTKGSIYYLSSATPGLGTTTLPTGTGFYKALFYAVDTSTAFILDDRAKPANPDWATITNKPTTTDWSAITGKPATFGSTFNWLASPTVVLTASTGVGSWADVDVSALTGCTAIILDISLVLTENNGNNDSMTYMTRANSGSQVMIPAKYGIGNGGSGYGTSGQQRTQAIIPVDTGLHKFQHQTVQTGFSKTYDVAIVGYIVG